MTKTGSPTPPSLWYSTDGISWSSFTVGTTTITLPNIGDKVMLRSTFNSKSFASSTSNYCSFSMTGKIAASGSMDSVLPMEYGADWAFCRLFINCTSLTSAPELPAVKLAGYCYRQMFQGCSALTSAPELPATTLAPYCYYQMFQGCSALTSAPELPATTLAPYCYYQMFQGCSALTSAPELPATTLTEFCYRNMFVNCSALTTAPELPATTLAESCYQNMFSNCSALTDAPELPATTLADSGYRQMFSNCSSLTSAPDIPATTASNRDYACYRMFYNCTGLERTGRIAIETATGINALTQMFYGCSKLKYIELTGMTSWSAKMTNWVNGVAANGLFVCPAALGTESTITRGTANCPAGWKVNNYWGLTFEAEQANSTISMYKASSAPNISIQTSVDGVNWAPFTVGTTIITLANVGDKVYFAAGDAGNTRLTSARGMRSNKFILAGKVSASGNIMSLLNNSTPSSTSASFAFTNLFSCDNADTSLSDVSLLLLPATSIDRSCYENMFKNCAGIVTAPHLPATTISQDCYRGMFNGCSSLSQVSVSFIEWQMYPPPDETLPYNTINWLDNVASTGNFYCPASLGTDSTMTRGQGFCPTGWTVVNT